MITVDSVEKLAAGKTVFVGGEWVGAASGRTFSVTNPATDEVVGNVADASGDDTRKAIEAAAGAFEQWSRTPAPERGLILRKVATEMRERTEELARQLTLEQGKPVPEAAGEIEYAAGFLDWFAGEAERTYGDVIPPIKAGKRHFVVRQAVGVVGAITPWNFPAAMVTRKVAPALAAGCTVVLKPAEQTPLTAISIVEIFRRLGLPPGVLNMVTTNTPEAVGEELLDNRSVRKITFTGSTAVGKHLMRGAAGQMKRLSLELGGHAPVIVFQDADLDVAVTELLKVKFRNGGQTCLCPNRVFVHEEIYEPFKERLVEAVKRLRVGNGLEKDVDLGPMIDEDTFVKVKEHLEDALELGAELLCGENGNDGSRQERRFIQPTVIAGVDERMRVMKEETFGPVLPLTPFSSEQEAYRRANDTDYGLAAYVFTENLSRAVRASERLEYGIVGVNEALPASLSQVPFGGFKESGIGREGGAYGIGEFMEVKLVGMSLNETMD